MDKIRKIYEELNESEKFGLQFGLFPYEKTQDLTKEESLKLMELYKKEQGKFIYE